MKSTVHFTRVSFQTGNHNHTGHDLPLASVGSPPLLHLLPSLPFQHCSKGLQGELAGFGVSSPSLATC